MVKQCLLVVVAHAALHAPLADARPPDRDDDPPPDEIVEELEVVDDDPPGFNMFGFQMAIGTLPHDATSTLAMSLGLSVEHPVFRKTRVFAEYDWLWLSRGDDEPRGLATGPRPERHATGHRATLGLRRELTAKGTRTTRMFIDGELGGSMALVNDNMAGVSIVPAAFAGLRVGYDLYSRRDDSPSRTFEIALLLRLIGVPDGVGLTLGLGMFWGN